MNTSISLPVATEKKIRSREGLVGTFSGQVNADLTLCWALLDLGRLALRKKITRPEIMVILDALKDTTWDATQIPMWIQGGVGHQVKHCMAYHHLDMRWQIHGPVLLDKINALTDLETVALLDFCRDMWRQKDTPGRWEAEIASWQE